MKALVTQSCTVLCNSMDYNPLGSSVQWNSPGKNTAVGTIPFSRGSSQPRDRTEVYCTADRSFIIFWISKREIIHSSFPQGTHHLIKS